MSTAQTRLIEVGVAILFCLLPARWLRADSWALPGVSTNRSVNGVFELVVTPSMIHPANDLPPGPSATLRRKQDGIWTNLWERKLINRVAPVSAMVADSGRYVVTFDEWHSVGKKPVVIYDESGRLIGELSLADLKLEDHPNISRSVSSYWWNDHAIMLFGPPAGRGAEPWQKTLEDSLFIRLYWGEVLAIDLSSAKLRNNRWWRTQPAAHAAKLKKATTEYLEASWRRLADEYLRKANFEPDPKHSGVTGILLAGQLRLREALPLLREIAATGRFHGWAAPEWKGADNLQELAQTAIAEIEKGGHKP